MEKHNELAHSVTSSTTDFESVSLSANLSEPAKDPYGMSDEEYDDSLDNYGNK